MKRFLRQWFSLVAFCVTAGAQDYDLLIRNGRVLDGSGNPWFNADVAVKNGRIQRAGGIPPGATARRVIDASGKFVTPGFIDLHSHSVDPGYTLTEAAVREQRYNVAMIAQGITLSVVNQDGRGPASISKQRAELERTGAGNNLILLAGHGSIRSAVLKEREREKATAADIKAMRSLLETAMQEGAWGLSAGLEYLPGRYSDTAELVELVRVLKPYRGVYISHERSEGADPMWKVASDRSLAPNLIDAVLETIEIGRKTGVTVVCSHIKAKGAAYWGSSHAAVRLIQEAREEGVPVYADQYPYDSSGTDGRTVLIPLWSIVAPGQTVDGQILMRRNWPDAKDNLATRLANPETAVRIRFDIAREIERRGGAARIVIHEFPDSRYVGKTLAWLARDRKLDPVEAVIWIQMNGASGTAGGARMRGHSIAEEDIEHFMRQEFTATSTDGASRIVHPRSWGTFARRIQLYTVERKVTSLAFAVRAMTSLPAQILGLRDRGTIREGNWADLVVFDPAEVREMGTFEKPEQSPRGFDFVFVNGVAVVDEGKPVLAAPGMVLRPEPK